MKSLKTWTPRERLFGVVSAFSMALSILAVSGLGGGVSEAQPQHLIQASEIANGAITSAKIKNGGVRGVDLGRGASHSFYFVEGAEAPIPAGTSNSAAAGCKNGDESIGGGYLLLGPTNGVSVTASRPENKASGWFWGVEGENNASSGTVKIQPIASCVHYE